VKKHKILVVDDETMVAQEISSIIKETDKYDVVIANSGEDAIKFIKSSNFDDDFDVILLDIRMPKMSGIETLQKIHAMKPSIRVIMVTALDDAKNAWDALKGGAFDYITKPFKNDDLIKRVGIAAEGRKIYLEKDRAWDKAAGLLSLAMNDRRKYEEIVGEWSKYNDRKDLHRPVPNLEDVKFMLEQREKDPKWYEKA
jgi:DNA-binding NtrC family response regulator